MCQTVSLSVRDFELNVFSRQKKLPFPDRTSSEIFKAAYGLFVKNHTSGKPVRSMSVSASNLLYTEEIQLSLDPDIMRVQRREAAERAYDSINERYGKNTICRAVYLAEPELTSLHIHSGAEHAMPGLMNTK